MKKFTKFTNMSLSSKLNLSVFLILLIIIFIGNLLVSMRPQQIQNIAQALGEREKSLVEATVRESLEQQDQLTHLFSHILATQNTTEPDALQAVDGRASVFRRGMQHKIQQSQTHCKSYNLILPKRKLSFGI